MPDKIIQHLKSKRKSLGLSQTDIANLIGRKTYQTIHQWEKGTNCPNLKNLKDWANALGYDLVLTPKDD